MLQTSLVVPALRPQASIVECIARLTHWIPSFAAGMRLLGLYAPDATNGFNPNREPLMSSLLQYKYAEEVRVP
ncbi:hypothetical protein CY34DRAFT_281121 [Suillus luteus UH-Slu-Lm8-n1]|uniref:Uncharacterized protein n=1 Tax=Suillus luteus UH-Slu-Lm8-n1 TaxID=930992 RepID=A0A0D0BN69_9AGAM|nr:hypothetical protein CY34DRAFT_281121 [Suillus luteus UH-Slu-Lm8-n1]